MSESTLNGTPSKSGVAMPILCGAVLAVVVGSLYLFYQLNLVRGDLDQVRDQLTQTRSQLTAEIARVHENSTVSTQISQSSVDALKAELDAARRALEIADARHDVAVFGVLAVPMKSRPGLRRFRKSSKSRRRTLWL